MAITEDGMEGMALVSGDERAQKVIAYLPKIDEETYSMNIGAQLLRQASINSLMKNIEEIEHLRDSLRSETLEKVGNELNLEKSAVVFEEVKDLIIVNGTPVTKFTAIQTPPSVLLSHVEPLCQTQWHQREPYNHKMTYGLVKSDNEIHQGYYIAGCGPICVAQILATIRPSITYNGVKMDWPYLKQTSKISTSDPAKKIEMVSSLVKACFDGTYATYKMNGDVNTSTSTVESNLVYFIRQYANTGLCQPWDALLIYNSITAYKPVAVFAQGVDNNNQPVGHAFILDGYIQCTKYYGAQTANQSGTTLGLVNQYDCYFHTNLGWGGSADGYYLIEKNSSVYFQTPSSSYNSSNIRILPDISRK